MLSRKLLYARVNNKMNMRRLLLAMMAASWLMAVQARASMSFNITFDIQGNKGSGTLTATDVGGGAFLVTDASVLVTSGSWSSATPYILAPNNYNYGTFGPYGQSSVGHFSGGGDLIYDNIVYRNNTPSLDTDGLAFWTASGLAGKGFNLWGNSTATDYEFAAGDNTQPNPLSFVDVRGGTVNISAVPEPSTYIAGAMLLLPFGLSGIRMLRKRQAA